MNKKILSLITCFILASITCLTGCSPTPLETPTGLKATDTKLTWNYVDGAHAYILSVDDTEYSTGENYYSFSNMSGLVNGQQYIAKVKSKGDGYMKLNSEYCQPITFTYYSNSEVAPPTPNAPPADDDTTTNFTASEKNQILNNTNTSKNYYGVGRTINVITDEYANFTAESVGSAKVFDNTKLSQLNWYKEFVGDMQSTSYKGTSMSEYYNELNVSFKNSLNASGSFSIFSASAENSFGFSSNISYKNTSNEIFYSASQYFGANLVAIDEYYDVRQFREVLSTKFINDVKAVQNGTMSAAELINLYGTHAVVAGYYGGKISYDYYLNSNSTKWDTNVAFNYANKVGAAIEGIVSAGTETTLSVASKIGQNIEVSEERFTAKAIGGENFNASSLEEYKANYNVWVNSMNNSAIEKNVIVGLPQKSLIAIWDLLPIEYSTAKQIVSDYFYTQANSVSNDFLSKYQRHYEEPNAPTESTAVDYKTLSCGLDNGYNNTQPQLETNVALKHDHFKLGHFNILNANVLDDNLELIKGYNTSINFVVDHDTTNLPTAGETTSSKISNDNYRSSKLYNLPYNVGEQTVGYGLIVATVTYQDNSPQEVILLKDVFKEKKMKDSITIIESSLLQKNCTVNISIIYEVHYYMKYWFPNWDNYRNWRINKTFTVTYQQ